jgi:thioredoxin reductase
MGVSGGASKSIRSIDSSALVSTTVRHAATPVWRRNDVYLIGAGNSAGQAAIFFSNHADR